MIKRIADKHGKSVQQVLLRWAVQYGQTGVDSTRDGTVRKNLIAVIPGTGKPKHMESNLGIYDFVLDSGDMERMRELREDKTLEGVIAADDMVWPEGL